MKLIKNFLAPHFLVWVFFLLLQGMLGQQVQALDFSRFKHDDFEKVDFGAEGSKPSMREQLTHLHRTSVELLGSLQETFNEDIVGLVRQSLAQITQLGVQRDVVLRWIAAIGDDKERVGSVLKEEENQEKRGLFVEWLFDQESPKIPDNLGEKRLRDILISCQERLLRENFFLLNIGFWKAGGWFGIGSGPETPRISALGASASPQGILSGATRSRQPIFVGGQNHDILRILEYHPRFYGRFVFILSSQHFLPQVVSNTNYLLAQFRGKDDSQKIVDDYKHQVMQYEALSKQVESKEREVQQLQISLKKACDDLQIRDEGRDFLERNIQRTLDLLPKFEEKKVDYQGSMLDLQRTIRQLRGAAYPFEQASQLARVYLKNHVDEIFPITESLATVCVYGYSTKPIDNLSMLSWYLESRVAHHSEQHNPLQSRATHPAVGILQHLKLQEKTRPHLENCTFHIMMQNAENTGLYVFSSFQPKG